MSTPNQTMPRDFYADFTNQTTVQIHSDPAATYGAGTNRPAKFQDNVCGVLYHVMTPKSSKMCNQSPRLSHPKHTSINTEF